MRKKDLQIPRLKLLLKPVFKTSTLGQIMIRLEVPIKIDGHQEDINVPTDLIAI